MSDDKTENKQAERPTPRSNPQEDGSGGDTGVPSGEQGISNSAGDEDEDAEQDERRFNK